MRTSIEDRLIAIVEGRLGENGAKMPLGMVAVKHQAPMAGDPWDASRERAALQRPAGRTRS
jgi:hypothetical protein